MANRQGKGTQKSGDGQVKKTQEEEKALTEDSQSEGKAEKETQGEKDQGTTTQRQEAPKKNGDNGSTKNNTKSGKRSGGTEYLVEGAKLICVNSSVINTLNIPSDHKYYIGGKKRAVCTDCKAGFNINVFADCRVNPTTHVCTGYMALANKWQRFNTSTLSMEKIEQGKGKEDFPAMNSVLLCKKGGIIMPITSGQGFDDEVFWPAFNWRYQKVISWAVGKNPKANKFRGDPINVNIGNFIYESEELVIYGNTHMAFRLFYNAMEKKEGRSLGEGWHHNYEVFLRKEKDDTIQVCLGDGCEIPYRRVVGEIYAPVYGDSGRLKSVQGGYHYITQDGMEYFFGEDGLLYVKKDPDGNKESFTYNEQGLLTRAVGANGGEFLYVYNKEGRLIRVEDHTGRKVELWYQYGKLWKMVNAVGYAYIYSYNENGKMESVFTPRGVVSIKNTYDAADRVVKQEMPDGSMIELKYDDENRRTYMLEQNGSLVIYENDDRYRNVKTIYEDGEEIFAYNDQNLKTQYVDKNGNQTLYRYDQKGNLVEIENALGHKTKMEYNERSQLTVTKLPNGAVRINTYDKEGNLAERRDPMGNVLSMKYDNFHQLVEVMQEDGSKIHMVRDSKGNIICITDPMGNRVMYEYDSLNRVIKTIDGNGNTTKFSYNERNDIVESINAFGHKRTFEYNEGGKVTVMTDYDGYTMKASYDTSNRMERVEDKDGYCMSYVYDKSGNVVEENLPNGAKRCYTYNNMNQLSQREDEMGNVTKFEYDANGNRIKITEADGSATQFEYDALNRVCKVIEPDGLELCVEYNLQGKVAKVIYPSGKMEETEYDLCGRAVKTKDVYGNIAEIQYNPLGLPTKVTDEAGGKTIYEYYPGGLLKRMVNPDGTSVELSYDGNGNIIEKKNQENYKFYYVYDEQDRIVRITSNVGEKIEYEYDAVGNMTALTDGNGNVRKYEYSPSGRMTAVVDAEGNRSAYCYDCMGGLISVEQIGREDRRWKEQEDTAAFNEMQRHITYYERDMAGRLTAIIDALGNRETYRWNPLGRLAEKTDKEGYTTSYRYDFAGNVRQVTYGDGKSVQYEYNALRQLIRIKDWLGETNIEPDAYGRAASITDSSGNTIKYEYGNAGEKRTIVYPDGEKTEYFYDSCRRLIRVHTGVEDVTYRYDTNGRLTEKFLPGGTSTVWQYDRAGRVTGLTNRSQGGILDELHYEYDALSNRTEVWKKRRGMPQLDGYYCYRYDIQNRLTEVERDGSILRRYGYDEYGNRAFMEAEGKRTTYTYNAANHLIETEGNRRTTYNYDRRGNLTSIWENGEEILHYEYNADSRIVSAAVHDGRCAGYFYNGMGQRTGMEVFRTTSDGGRDKIYKKQFVLDLTLGYNNLLQETNGKETRKYLWDSGPLVMKDGTTEKYYLNDDLGSPIRLLYRNGNLSEDYDYDEFGNLQHGDWGGAQPFGFTGYQKDVISGSYFAQAREYLPREGRFAGRDAFGGELEVPASMNGYVYCYHNPFGYVDPLGYLPYFLRRMLDGTIAHELLQEDFLNDFLTNRGFKGEKEKGVEGYQHNKSNKGEIDIFLEDIGNNMGAEVYEIKPITQHYRLAWDKMPENNIHRFTGVDQRLGYVDALQNSDVTVNPTGTTFNPNGYMIRTDRVTKAKKDKHMKPRLAWEILYMTFPDEPGMIYYVYVQKPDSEPETESKKGQQTGSKQNPSAKCEALK